MLQYIIGSIIYRLTPLVAGSFLDIFMIGKVLEPGVFLGSMPVLHLGRNSDDGAWSHLNGSLAPFLIPAAPSNADEHLYLLVVNMPVIATTRFEGDVHHTTADICQIALTNEILSVRIRLALGPLGVQGVTFVAEPSAELIDLLL